MYAYTNRDRVFFTVGFLHSNTTLDSIESAIVNAQTTIAVKGNDLTIILSRKLFQVFAVGSDLSQGSSFIFLDESSIPLDISKHDGSKLPDFLIGHVYNYRVTSFKGK